LTGVTSANAATFTNGSFESGIAPGTFTTLSGGDSTSITGWTVDPVNIDYIGSYWQAGDGNRSIDMNGLAHGGLTQTFDTTAGQAYKVTFLLSGNPDNGHNPAIKTLDVLTNNVSHPFSFDTTGNSLANMGWTQESFTFVAGAGNSSTIDFKSTTFMPEGCPCFGPALDGVSVTAVPEPESYAMMLAGLGLMGFIARRRRSANTAA
jgi:choice-of-anchor C domain-containing protein